MLDAVLQLAKKKKETGGVGVSKFLSGIDRERALLIIDGKSEEAIPNSSSDWMNLIEWTL